MRVHPFGAARLLDAVAWQALVGQVELRPVRHHTDPKVRAHVVRCVLALLVERVLEDLMRRGGLNTTAPAALEELRTCRLNELTLGATTTHQLTEPTPTQRAILTAVGMTDLIRNRTNWGAGMGGRTGVGTARLGAAHRHPRSLLGRAHSRGAAGTGTGRYRAVTSVGYPLPAMPIPTPTPPPLDVLVIGGGPAGATLASILLRHRPQARVRIVERDTFPRFHVGETLVSDINLVLDEMGAYEAVSAAGFVKKYGATFRWGLSPEPWHMIFASLDELRPAHTTGVQTAFTWHVDRAVYDTILLDNARALGAEVVVGAVRSLLESEGRVVGVRMGDGSEHHARFVADATGQSGLCGSLADRVVDPHLRNIAAWGYYRGFEFEPELNGTWDSSRAFIVAHEYGWSWYFPIRTDLVSVGVVMHRDDLNGERAETRFAAAIGSCPELSRLLRDATLVPYSEGAPLVHVIRDYSYLSSSIYRPGFVRVGDAAGFVDPILSVGCFLGQSGARMLAYGLRTLLDGDGRLDEATVLGAYSDHVLETLRAFREVTWFFYRFNERPDAWWGEARRQVGNAGFPSQAHDRHAFTAFATGFAARRSVFREPNGMFGEPFFEDAFRRLVNPEGASPPAPRLRLKSTDRPRLLGRADLRASAVPVDGEGRMIPALRVEVHTPNAHGGDALVRRLFVPPSMAPLFAWLDGTNDISTIVRRLQADLHVGREHEAALVRYVRGVVEGLVERGLAER